MATKTLVHVMRHGEVFNPEKVLYGRLPGYKLSELGLKMADRAAEHFKNSNLSLIVSSPLERAQQTAAPTANVHNLKPELESLMIKKLMLLTKLRLIRQQSQSMSMRFPNRSNFL